MSGAFEQPAELLRVLGHPLRLAILSALVHQERPVTELAQITGIAMSALSQQLAILRKAELVRTRRDAKQVFYSLERATLGEARSTVDGLIPPGTASAGETVAPVPVAAAMFARMRPREA